MQNIKGNWMLFHETGFKYKKSNSEQLTMLGILISLECSR